MLVFEKIFYFRLMKKIILTLVFFASLFVKGQTIQKFYDWQWNPCEPGLSRFYSEIKKTDSGWYRNDYYTANNSLQMRGLYKDNACKIKNGMFTFFYANGNVSDIRRYNNNKSDGIALSFHNNGMMSDSVVYELDKPVGIEFSWYANGYLLDSIVHNRNGSDVEVYWFDNGSPSCGGNSVNDKKEGKWVYYHKNGKTAAIENYKNDKLVSGKYYDEEGKEMTDAKSKDREAQFNGGLTKWKKFLESNLQFPSGYVLKNTDIVTVVIAATIDEEGNVEDAYVEIPFNTVFDTEALRVLKKSPKWLPAIGNNRRIKMQVRQPISFKQVVED